MKLERDVAPGIHRVEDSFVNWYLVEDGDRLTVVDAGLPRSWRSLRNALDELGRSAGDIDALVLTHAHYDHVGFAEKARKDLGIPVHAHRDETWLARHPFRYRFERSPARYLGNPEFLKVAAGFTTSGFPFVRGVREAQAFAADGQALGVPGSPRVVFTPGHTFGSVSLHLAERDAVIVGDAIVTLDPYTGREGPRLVARAATADVDQARSSLDAIAATGAATVLTGHGEPWRNGAEKAARLARDAPVG